MSEQARGRADHDTLGCAARVRLRAPTSRVAPRTRVLALHFPRAAMPKKSQLKRRVRELTPAEVAERHAAATKLQVCHGCACVRVCVCL